MMSYYQEVSKSIIEHNFEAEQGLHNLQLSQLEENNEKISLKSWSQMCIDDKSMKKSIGSSVFHSYRIMHLQD